MIEIGSALDPGKKRIARKNQDALSILYPDSWDQHQPLLVIADGMGGYEGGAVASQLVVECFTRVFHSEENRLSPLESLQAGVSSSLQAMKDRAAREPALARMGSTVVAAYLHGQQVHLINVGDSRAYLINPTEIRQVSYDHSLVGEHLRQGLISEAELRNHPRRNILSMAISAQREEVETYTSVFGWQPGDYLVLCSDGLWGPVFEAQIQSIVLELPPQQAADRLVEMANQNQGPDNISVIVARFY